MEPPRDENNQIHAEFARRIGEIVRQYKKVKIPEEEIYEVTLNLIALQSLLAQCKESHDALKPEDRKSSILAKPVANSPGLWGIHKELVKENTFEEPFTYFELFFHIRHALSHPTDQLKPHSTGYTTTGNNPSRRVEAIRFIRAPDKGPNKDKKFCIEIPVETIQELVLGLSGFMATAKTK